MAYWLAQRRHAQESSFIQRFDPRFWTVNFPRPAMASVVTTGPDSLRVDLELHHEGELVGLIWDSTDALDHPLLAYETDRDYSHTTLRFRWQSEGIIPLDQPFGPTLTIEGFDESDQPKTWFVRLWNYAEGSPENALITLPFSDLEGGFALPGDRVNPKSIERLFISLVAPHYVANSAAPLPQRFNGYATVSELETDGQRSMLAVGDVRMPPHGERIATAYDDAFNQTPSRLLRNIVGLGYREDLVHYVGMSHFMRLERQPDNGLRVPSAAELCNPAAAWHRDFFGLCRENQFEAIGSISYELFDEFCPEEWKQRTAAGEPALTGWIPPSTLLSPSNSEAMDWLIGSALAFVDLQEQAQLPVRMQIGEPWWWVTASGEICLYDSASQAALGPAPVVIDNLRHSLNSEQTALLDQAGEILAQSTANLASAIRNRATADAEVLLLAFTPTVLDPQTPEQHRANLPIGWAYPAFDRLQLEDYDWLTAGADALRRAAYQFVDTRLGYPADGQDYLAGFVLDPSDAEEFWGRIDAGLDEALTRGVSRRYVWALPQVTRDGYTRLPSMDEESMEPFDNVLYPFALGRNTAVAPEFSTSVTVTTSGHEQRNSLWSDARVHFDVGPGIRSEEELAELIAFFRARRGAARGFRISDPFDNSSNGMTSVPTNTDQRLGTGDGSTADFQIVKTYGSSSEPQLRPITRPRAETLLVSVNGVSNSNWTLGELGKLRFHAAPPAGAEIRAGFLFDVPVRFAEDRIDISGINFAAGEAPSIPLIELRETS